jgi:Protein of unknown function (DUF2505)
MSRRLDYTVKFDAPAEKIYQNFVSRQYWETLMAAYQSVTPRSEITRFHCGDDGTSIVFTQTLPRAYLPPIARTVMPVDMVITREQHFEPYDRRKKCASGRYAASIPAGPGHFGGRYTLTETHAGSALKLASVCKVHIPFIGGKLEDLILTNIALLFEAEAAFTADWICQHH